MKPIIFFLLTTLAISNAWGIILGEKPYKIEVQKNKSGKITFHVVNIRSFSDVKELGKWCYKTTKEKNNKIKEYGNFVDIVFQEEFSTEEINEIVMILLNEKVYTNEIIIIDESMIRKYKWKPEFKK